MAGTRWEGGAEGSSLLHKCTRVAKTPKPSLHTQRTCALKPTGSGMFDNQLTAPEELTIKPCQLSQFQGGFCVLHWVFWKVRKSLKHARCG